jgi:hypothetical protein
MLSIDGDAIDKRGLIVDHCNRKAGFIVALFAFSLAAATPAFAGEVSSARHMPQLEAVAEAYVDIVELELELGVPFLDDEDADVLAEKYKKLDEGSDAIVIKRGLTVGYYKHVLEMARQDSEVGDKLLKRINELMALRGLEND